MGCVNVDQMLDTIDPLQLYGWWIHYSKKLTPSERGDIGQALSTYWIIKVMCQAWGVKPEHLGLKGPFTPSMFAPWQPLLKEFDAKNQAPQSEAEMKQRLQAAAGVARWNPNEK